MDIAAYTATFDTALQAALLDAGEVIDDTPGVDPQVGGWLFDERYTGSWNEPDSGELALILHRLRVAIRVRIAFGQAIHVVRRPYLYQWEQGWGIRAVFGPPS